MKSTGKWFTVAAEGEEEEEEEGDGKCWVMMVQKPRKYMRG